MSSAATTFTRTAAADAHAVSRLREEFSRWLRDGFHLDAVRFSDIVLAVNEAMSNAAEFAYRDGGPDTFSVQASSDDVGSLVVTVADNGAWREQKPEQRCSSRGRGIPLMKALSDRFTLDPSPHGTRVRMAFDDCASAPHIASA